MAETVTIDINEWETMQRNIRSLLLIVKDMSDKLEQKPTKKAPKNFWDEDEVKGVLGLPDGDAGRRQLNAFAALGELKTIRKSKPRKYLKTEVMALLDKINRGDIQIPKR